MLGRTFDRVLAAGAVISALFLFGDALLTTVAVLGRYLFNQPLGWYVEIVEYSLIFVTFLSTAWLLHHDGHVKIELVTQRIRNVNLRLAARVFSRAFVIIVGAVLTVYGIIVMVDMINGDVVATKILSIPRWIIVLPVPIGSLLLFFEGIRQLVSLFKRSGGSPVEASQEAVDIDQV